MFLALLSILYEYELKIWVNRRIYEELMVLIEEITNLVCKLFKSLELFL